MFHILILPWVLGLGTGLVLSQLGMDVNWLRLIFYLSVAIALSLTFHINFCIVFLLPFSVALTFWSSSTFPLTVGILFSLMLGLGYGLTPNSAKWGVTAGLVYGVVFTLILDPLSGLAIGAAFLAGYFRIVFYILEAPLSWALGILATKENALRLWQFNPAQWDELIWFPLPGLGRHMLAIKKQDEAAFQTALLQVQDSFRQSWSAEQIKELRAIS